VLRWRSGLRRSGEIVHLCARQVLERARACLVMGRASFAKVHRARCLVDVIEDVVDYEVGAGLVIVANELDPSGLWLIRASTATQDEGVIVGAHQHGLARVQVPARDGDDVVIPRSGRSRGAPGGTAGGAGSGGCQGSRSSASSWRQVEPANLDPFGTTSPRTGSNGLRRPGGSIAPSRPSRLSATLARSFLGNTGARPKNNKREPALQGRSTSGSRVALITFSGNSSSVSLRLFYDLGLPILEAVGPMWGCPENRRIVGLPTSQVAVKTTRYEQR